VGVLLRGREALVESQWKKIWGVTSGFCFDLDRLTCGTDGDLAWVAVPWASRCGAVEGGPLDRTGRATYVLQRHGGQWRAVHSHHSLDPSGLGR
jgi:ketosteroid isomerase-like protein